MKYAIYDKAADGYLTKMVFEVGHSEHTQFECGLNEYITKAELLDTKEAANLAITRIEDFQFMEKGRFVVHSFDETLADQYIISEAGNPTKVVDNITVDLDGTINVKYGTMMSHWSTMSLEYAINRLNKLQEAASDVYTPWRNTFDVYKVITVIDEKKHTHYQFINVTDECLEKYLKDEEELNKNSDTSAKNASKYHTAIANDIIDICEADDKFEVTLKKFLQLYEAIYVPMAHDDVIIQAFKGVLETFSSIEDKVRKIIDESVEWKNKAITAEKAKDNQKKLNEANVATIVRYRNETMNMNKEIKELRTMRDCLAEIIHAIRNAICDNNSGAFDCIESRMIHDSDFNSSPFMAGVGENIKDICIAGKKLNYTDTDIIAQMDDKLRDMVKESNHFHDNRNRLISIIYDIRNAIYNKDSGALCCINNSIIHDADFDDDLAMESAGGNLRDICNACYINITNNDLKNREIAKLAKEKDKALEQKEFYKRQANSVYGMAIPCRCNGKQMFYDVTTGNKILVDKEKYNSLVECINNINITYDILKCTDWTMDKPSWFDGVINRINNLTK